MSSSVSQLCKLHNIGIDVAIFHLELLHLIASSFMLGDSRINAQFFELSFHDVPSGHVKGDCKWIGINFVKPVVLPHNPSFDVRSFKEGQEVCAFFKRVASNICIVVHVHKPFKLG